MSDALRRAVLIVVVVAVIVGVGLADTGPGSGRSVPPGSPAGAVVAVTGTGVAAGGAESSAWFCTGGTGAGGNARAAIVLTNPGPRAVTGTVTTVTTGGGAGSGRVSMAVSVPGHMQTAVDPAPAASGGALASTVVFEGGAVGASQVVTGPLGYTAAPCASSTSGSWFFADGSTAGNDSLSLSLFNPGRTTAVVDVSFVTAGSGLIVPPAYQGIDVPGGALVVENVGDHVRNTADMATVVSLLSGAVVAAELQSAGQAGDSGPSVILGAREPSTLWSFAQNMNVGGADTVFHLFNPTDRRAQVTLRIGLQQGAAEPLAISVPARSVSVFDAAKVTRIPGNSPFSATFSTEGGAGIVVSRSLSSVAGTPAPQRGEVAGVPGGSARWLVPATNAPATGVSELTVVDVSPSAVTVRLVAVSTNGLVPVAGFGQRRLRPGTPLIVRPEAGSMIGAAPLEVVSTGPVAVEVDAIPVGNTGVVVIPALPLP